MTKFVVLEPEDWGMRWAKPPVSERQGDVETYIHHSAGNAYRDLSAKTAFFLMNEYAITAKGYSAIDYDIMVHENPKAGVVTIGIARGKWLSAATKDRNEDGEAICALGYFHPGHALSALPSAGMLEGLARAVVLSIERGWSSRSTKILGHRDNPAHPGATGCPGDYLYARLPEIRTRVEQLLGAGGEDDMPARELIVRPPTNLRFELKGGKRVEAPWFYIHNGDVRYAIGADNRPDVEKVDETALRYSLLYEQVYHRQPALVS